MQSYCVKGTFLDAPAPGALRVRTGVLLVENGRVSGFSEQPAPETTLPVYDFTGDLILPGFTDLHLHAPQYRYAGTAMDLELLEWLQKYTYPEEARYADPAYAQAHYAVLADDLLHSVTTRACVFASLHADSTLQLMDLLENAGLVSYVGKLNMNRNAPDYYSELTAAHGMAETVRWVDACEQKHYKNTYPMLTPRFTPSVTDDYMRALGELAAARGLPMQSHLSENTDEIAWVQSLCPDTAFYGESYSRYGLFGGSVPTVMAHCIYSGDAEKRLMKQNGVFIAHCPTSNENVIAGIAPAAEYLREGYHVGLGTDVAGGHTLDLLQVMTAAVQCSKLRWKYVDKTQKPLTLAEAFYMATAGGGAFFGKAGLFAPGYEFDAVILRDGQAACEPPFTEGERLERAAYTGKAAIAAKFVRGAKIL